MMNTKLNLLLIAILLGALSFTACKKDEEDDDKKPKPITGFTFGKLDNTWFFNTETAMFTDTTTYLKLVQNLGSNKFACIFSMMDGMMLDTVYFYMSTVELADYPDDDMPNEKFTMVKSNSAVNDLFTFVDSWGDTLYRKVVSIDQQVTVPAGTFSCYKIEQWDSYDPTQISTFHINKTSGFILIEFDDMALKLRSKSF